MAMGKVALGVTFTAAAIAGAGIANASPDTPTCADVDGAFVAHGTDGRGDCMSADPRHKCHIPQTNRKRMTRPETTLPSSPCFRHFREERLRHTTLL